MTYDAISISDILSLVYISNKRRFWATENIQSTQVSNLYTDYQFFECSIVRLSNSVW